MADQSKQSPAKKEESEAPVDEEFQGEETDLWKSCRVGDDEGKVMVPGAKSGVNPCNEPTKPKLNGLETYNSNAHRSFAR